MVGREAAIWDKRSKFVTRVSAIVQVEVTLWPTVNRPAHLGVRHPSGAHDQIFITVGHLCSLWCGAPFLTSGWVYNLLVQFAVTLRSKSRRIHGHILFSRLRLSYPGGPGPCIFIPQEQGDPFVPPSTEFPVLGPLTTRRTAVESFWLSSTRVYLQWIIVISFYMPNYKHCGCMQCDCL
jgi:hypothetical protein